MEFKGQHILTSKQFDKASLLELFKTAADMESIIAKVGQTDLLKGKVMASLFFEPSTRTRFSFETAMHRLGGSVVMNFDMINSSSLTKLETLYDTGKVVSQMVDVIVARHVEKGGVVSIADGSDVPVINAGDGPGEHPTQGLLDLYTIWKEKGRLDGLTVGMVGDLKYGRVPHSQLQLLSHFDVKFVLISPEALKMPSEFSEMVEALESEDFEAHIGDMDVISMTRVQKERFDDAEEYNKYADAYILDAELMKKAKSDAIVLHPLPRVKEIAQDVDDDERAKYFDQVKNGVAVRMALLLKVLS